LTPFPQVLSRILNDRGPPEGYPCVRGHRIRDGGVRADEKVCMRASSWATLFRSGERASTPKAKKTVVA
jgi:hypothetical protein